MVIVVVYFCSGCWLCCRRKECAGMANSPPRGMRWYTDASWSRGEWGAESKGSMQDWDGPWQQAGLSSNSAETRGFVSLCRSKRATAGSLYIWQGLCLVGCYPNHCPVWLNHHHWCPLNREGEYLCPGGMASHPETGLLLQEASW